MPVRFSSTTEIAAPPERVYECLTDLEGYGAWMSGLVHIERLTEGPFATGTRWREARRVMGREGREVFEVTATDPPHGISLYVDGSQGSSRKGAYHFRYRLTEGAGGPGTTCLELDAEIDVPGIIAKLMGRMALGSFKQAIAKDKAAMKAYLESDRVSR